MTHLTRADYQIVDLGGSNIKVIGPDEKSLGVFDKRTGSINAAIDADIQAHNAQTISKMEITPNQIISQTKSFFSNPLVIIGVVAAGLILLGRGSK